ncbi:MAG: peroxiredoxin-like family protein [Phycisphaerales bacterium]
MHTLLTITAVASLMGSAQLNAELSSSANSESSAETTTQLMDIERLKVGDTFADFTIPTPVSPTDSDELQLSTMLESGPVVVTFFRGSWCPYCRNELSDIQDNIKKFQDLGATIIAVSPELPEKSEELNEKLDLGFYVAHDENNDFARSLGLTFKLDAKTIKKYREYNINLPKANGTRKWELPVPATYVISQDSTVAYVYDNEDYSKRASHKEILAALLYLQAED